MYFVRWSLRKCHLMKKESKAEVAIQALEPFNLSLRRKQMRAWLKEETVCRDKFSIYRLPLDSYQQLVKDTTVSQMIGNLNSNADSNRGGRMQGIHTYNILALEEYSKKYMYQSYNVPHRSDYIVSMYKHPEMRKLSVDIVRLVTDIAFVPNQRARDM